MMTLIHPIIKPLFILSLVLFLSLAQGANPAHAATFTVTTTADDGDVSLVPGSLREAMTDANAAAGADVIAFAVPGCGPGTTTVCTIIPLTPLPDITEAVAIDGQLVGGAPGIVLDGSSFGGRNNNGLTFASGAGGSSVEGLSITGFPGRAIQLNGASNLLINNNVISGNAREGVRLFFAADVQITNNDIQSNSGTAIFGTGSDGMIILNNILSNGGNSGISMVDSSGGLIQNNIIENNPVGGITLAGGSSGNLIADNYLANQANRSIALGHPVFLATNGSLAFQRAVTAGALNNNYDGINNNTFLRNTVLDTGASAGVIIGGDPTPALIAEEQRLGALGLCGGGSYPDCCPTELQADGSCKLVHDDVRALLQASDLTSRGNSILEMSIFDNAGLGIDLTEVYRVSVVPNAATGLFILEPVPDGVTPNDRKDKDTGANNLQNFPVLKKAKTKDGDIKIDGKLKSEPRKDYRIDFYTSPKGTASPVEGKEHLGFMEVSTNKGGKASFKAEFGAVDGGSLVTATATEILVNLPGSDSDEYGSTSEFSKAVKVKKEKGKKKGKGKK